MEEEQLESSTEQIKMGGGASNFRPWLYKKGQSGNPKGRPPGPSMKTWFRDKMAKMTDDEREDFIGGMPKDILWRMGEGQPHQSNELDVKGVLKIEFHNAFNKDEKEPNK